MSYTKVLAAPCAESAARIACTRTIAGPPPGSTDADCPAMP